MIFKIYEEFLKTINQCIHEYIIIIFIKYFKKKYLKYKMNYYSNPYFPLVYNMQYSENQNQLDNNFNTLFMEDSPKNAQLL